MDFAIEAEGLYKRYARKSPPAIDGLDFAIQPGQLFGLVGPDGSGKTTTLRIISSVMEMSGGKATVAGNDVKSHPDTVRKQIGYMPQNFSLYPDLSVTENLNFFADIHRVAGQPDRPVQRFQVRLVLGIGIQLHHRATVLPPRHRRVAQRTDGVIHRFDRGAAAECCRGQERQPPDAAEKDHRRSVPSMHGR